MADIAKCANGETCCLRTTCYRYTVTPSRWQSYIAPPDPGPDCEYYWPVEPTNVNQPSLEDEN